MLNISNLSFYLGNKQLYDDCSVFIKPNDKIGFVGPNGAGKSTLLRLIMGELKPDSGKISLQNGFTLGFLNQDLLSYVTDEDIKHVALHAFDEVIKINHEIEVVLKEMEENYSDQLLEKLTKLQEQVEHLGGYEMESKTEAVLEGMGFKTSDLDRPLKEFSGGSLRSPTTLDI